MGQWVSQRSPLALMSSDCLWPTLVWHPASRRYQLCKLTRGTIFFPRIHPSSNTQTSLLIVRDGPAKGALYHSFPAYEPSFIFFGKDHEIALMLRASSSSHTMFGAVLARSYPPLSVSCSFALLAYYRGLQPEGLLPARGVARSGFRPLSNILDCCHP